MSEEIEHRLQRSFTSERLLLDAMEMAYGQKLTGLVLVMADAVRDAVPNPLREAWVDDVTQYLRASRAVSEVLSQFRPSGEPAVDQTDRAGAQAWVLKDLKSSKEGNVWHKEKRRLLGHLVDRLENFGTKDDVSVSS